MDLGRFGALRTVVEVQLEVLAGGPLLVRGPDAFVPDAPDMAFVRYPTPHGDIPFLPGSSLKGVMRAGVECLLRGLGVNACDVTRKDRRCKNAASRCKSCLLFGSTEGASVLLVEDGMPWPGDATEEERARAAAGLERCRAVRAGVGINRETGAVGVGPFDYEVLVGASFFPTLRLRNPEPWSVACVAAALRLLDEGVLRIGSGTSRGLGRVLVSPRRVRVRGVRQDAIEPLTRGMKFGQVASDGLLTWQDAEDPAAVVEGWASRLKDQLER